MSTTSVRIAAADSAVLNELAQATGKTKVAILHEALEAMATKAFWDGFNRGYEEDGEAIKAEVAIWDVALNDGLLPLDAQ
jgi:predicted transcriptional regulator